MQQRRHILEAGGEVTCGGVHRVWPQCYELCAHNGGETMVHGWGICPTKKCGVGPAEQVGTYQTEELDLILLDDLIPRLTQEMDGREGGLKWS